MGQRILVVDDSPTMRELLKGLLAEQGYEVTTVCDGDQALTAVCESLPNLILMDILMPNMDGYTMLRTLRRQEGCRAIPVIVLSVKRQKGLEDLFQFEKISAFIEKPFDQMVLLNEVKKALTAIPS